MNVNLRHHENPDECWEFVITQNGNQLWNHWFCPFSAEQFLNREPFYLECRNKAVEMGIPIETIEQLFDGFR